MMEGGSAGPVIFQDGDVYGQTVNLASRLASVAQAGEVVGAKTSQGDPLVCDSRRWARSPSKV